MTRAAKVKSADYGQALRDFERDLKEAMTRAEAETGASFSKMRALIDAVGGLVAARRLLEQPKRFSFGFTRLRDAKLLDCSVEQLVVNHRDSGLFSPVEVESAKWRLENKDQASA